jgi:replicative DNA helicase
VSIGATTVKPTVFSSPGDEEQLEVRVAVEPEPVEEFRPEPVQEKTAPYSLEAEESTVGGLLIDPDKVYDVMSFLEPEDFYIIKNGWVYETILALSERRVPVDFLTVCDELEGQQRLEQIGGAMFISALMQVVPTAIHTEAYARIVAGASKRRRLIQAAGEQAVLAFDLTIPVDEVVGRAEALVMGVSESGGAGEPVEFVKVLSEYFDKVQALSEAGNAVTGVPTGYKDLDVLLGGLQSTDLVIVAGRPSMGKTALMLGMAQNAAEVGHRVGVFSLEMSNEQVAQRIVSAHSGIPSDKLRSGNLHHLDWPGLVESCGKLSDLGLIVDDTPGLSPLELLGRARRMKMRYGIDLLIVDYLQLMTAWKEAAGRGSSVEQVTYISKSLKEIAKQLSIPLVAGSQLSRSCESRFDKRPILSDLRESGAIEQDADVVMFLYRDEYYNPETELVNIAEVIVRKHRNGPTGTVHLFFRKALAQFLDAEVHERKLVF